MVAVPLGESDGFAGSLAEEIKLGPAFLTASDRLNIQNVRRVQREDSLHAFVVDDSTDSKALVNTPAFPADHRPGKDLRAFLVALSDPAVNVYHVANLEMRNILLQTLAFNGI
jgi:hypothetical protein